jgi:hypothetical protein
MRDQAPHPHRWLAVAASALAVTLAGCVVAPVAPYGYDTYGYAVPVAPPPPQVEYIGPAPGVGYVWLNGYWGWSGGRHVWNGGRWEAPRPGYHWTPHSWSHDRDGWREHGGRWNRR